MNNLDIFKKLILTTLCSSAIVSYSHATTSNMTMNSVISNDGDVNIEDEEIFEEELEGDNLTNTPTYNSTSNTQGQPYGYNYGYPYEVTPPPTTTVAATPITITETQAVTVSSGDVVSVSEKSTSTQPVSVEGAKVIVGSGGDLGHGDLSLAGSSSLTLGTESTTSAGQNTTVELDNNVNVASNAVISASVPAGVNVKFKKPITLPTEGSAALNISVAPGSNAALPQMSGGSGATIGLAGGGTFAISTLNPNLHTPITANNVNINIGSGSDAGDGNLSLSGTSSLGLGTASTAGGPNSTVVLKNNMNIASDATISATIPAGVNATFEKPVILSARSHLTTAVNSGSKAEFKEAFSAPIGSSLRFTGTTPINGQARAAIALKTNSPECQAPIQASDITLNVPGDFPNSAFNVTNSSINFTASLGSLTTQDSAASTLASISTGTINGSYTATGTNALFVELNGAGDASLINIIAGGGNTGTASLDGDYTVYVMMDANKYTYSSSDHSVQTTVPTSYKRQTTAYTVLQTAGGITGNITRVVWLNKDNAAQLPISFTGGKSADGKSIIIKATVASQFDLSGDQQKDTYTSTLTDATITGNAAVLATAISSNESTLGSAAATPGITVNLGDYQNGNQITRVTGPLYSGQAVLLNGNIIDETDSNDETALQDSVIANVNYQNANPSGTAIPHNITTQVAIMPSGTRTLNDALSDVTPTNFTNGSITTLSSTSLSTQPVYIKNATVIAPNGINLLGTGPVQLSNNSNLTLGTDSDSNVSVQNTFSVESGATSALSSTGESTISGTYENKGIVNVTGAGVKTFSGQVSGNGVFNFTSTGKTNFTSSTTNSFNGTANVSNGEVKVNTNLSNATFNISDNGRISGAGTIGDLIQTGGTIRPGNSIGTLNVSSYTVSAPAIYYVEINANGEYSQIKSTGTVNLGTENLSVYVLMNSGTYNFNQITDYPIIVSTGGTLTGNIKEIKFIQQTGLKFEGGNYSNSTILLKSDTKGATTSFTIDENQTEADILAAISGSTIGTGTVNTTETINAGDFFNGSQQTSDTISAGAPVQGQQDITSQVFNKTLDGQTLTSIGTADFKFTPVKATQSNSKNSIESILMAISKSGPISIEKNETRLWITPYVNRSRTSRTASDLGSQGWSGGSLMGVEKRDQKNIWTFGALTGVMASRSHTLGTPDTFSKTKGAIFGVYNTYKYTSSWGHETLASRTYTFVDAQRFGLSTNTAKTPFYALSSYKTTTDVFNFQVNYLFDLIKKSATCRLNTGFTYTGTDEGAIKERNAGVNGNNSTSSTAKTTEWYSGVGLRKIWNIDNITIRTTFVYEYGYALSSTGSASKVTTQSAAPTTFTGTIGPKQNKHYFQLNTAYLDRKKGVKFILGYSSAFYKNVQNHTAMLKAEYRF